MNTTSALDKTFKNIWQSATRIKGGMGGKKMKSGGRANRRYNEKLQKSINWGNRECNWGRGEEKSRSGIKCPDGCITCQSCGPSSEVVDGVLGVD